MIAAFGTVALIAALLWRVPRLIRAPYDVATRCVVASLMIMAISTPLAAASVSPYARDILFNGSLKLFTNILQYAALWALGLFFLFAGHGATPAARHHARRETVLLVVAVIMITGAMLSTPPELRHHTFNSGDMRIAGIGGFYFFGGLYFVYMLARTSMWAWQYARESDIRMRWGLRMASMGLGISATASAIRAIYVAIRHFGGIIPRSALTAPAQAVSVGSFVFFGGIIIPALLIRVSATRTWWRHRSYYQEMRPLWEMFHMTYPKDELLRSRGTMQDRLSFWHVHRRYWRRRIEIRDGLVQVSPHLADLGFHDYDPPLRQAETLEHALRRERDGIEPTSHNAVRVAVPTGSGPDDEVQPLLSLARAVRAARTQNP